MLEYECAGVLKDVHVLNTTEAKNLKFAFQTERKFVSECLNICQKFHLVPSIYIKV